MSHYCLSDKDQFNKLFGSLLNSVSVFSRVVDVQSNRQLQLIQNDVAVQRGAQRGGQQKRSPPGVAQHTNLPNFFLKYSGFYILDLFQQSHCFLTFRMGSKFF